MKEKEQLSKLMIVFDEYSCKEENIEYWHARDLQKLLGYTQWRNFEIVIEKAKNACRNSKQLINSHFAEFSKVVNHGGVASQIVKDYKLTRYACYLIAQNGDSN
ncbi:MAG: hypothetical protein LBF97_03355 [Elusimicrobiota bacterium]|jgi:DNA-damage-inducible protein D|nr:hypothetical protein [Elusimicrobiota bacterium]